MTQAHSGDVDSRVEAKLRNVRPATVKQLAVWMNIPDEVLYQALVRLQRGGIVETQDSGKSLFWKIKS